MRRNLAVEVRREMRDFMAGRDKGMQKKKSVDRNRSATKHHRKMSALIAFNVDGLYIKLRGPWPKEIVFDANNNSQFADRDGLLTWLNAAWPGWRKNIVTSENLT
jgi:hypothetical protein